MPTATSGPTRRASSALMLSAFLLAAGCGSDTAGDSIDAADFSDRPSANEDVPQSSVGGSAVTVDGMTVEVPSAGLSELDGEPVVALTIKATNDGEEVQVSPQAFVVCNNGNAAIDRDGDYRPSFQLAPASVEEGEMLLSFGTIEGTTCPLPIEIDVRFRGRLGGIGTLNDATLTAATFTIDDALSADIISTIFAG